MDKIVEIEIIKVELEEKFFKGIMVNKVNDVGIMVDLGFSLFYCY